jgi:hypothetical protein
VLHRPSIGACQTGLCDGACLHRLYPLQCSSSSVASRDLERAIEKEHREGLVGSLLRTDGGMAKPHLRFTVHTPDECCSFAQGGGGRRKEMG